MKLVALIQARDNSQRLPKKATMDLNGKVMIQHVYNRLRMVSGLDEIVVSTSVDSPEVTGWCKVNDIAHYVGSEDDLLSRHMSAAIVYQADAILRITADCPFHDPRIIESVLRQFPFTKADAFVSWHHGRWTVSEGLDLAVVTLPAMRRLASDKHCPREDWISYMDQSPRYAVLGYEDIFFNTKRNGHLIHLSVDTPEDMERARMMMRILGDEYDYEETLKAYEATK